MEHFSCPLSLLVAFMPLHFVLRYQFLFYSQVSAVEMMLPLVVLEQLFREKFN